MCGIVGYLGDQNAVPNLLKCLSLLEYRGYDSAGIGIINESKLETRRSTGSNTALHELLKKFPLQGNLGIAHTRWATHGKPSDINTHPHTDCTGSIAIVHNGIIENYRVLKQQLESKGHHFRSQTDSEVIAHLLEETHADGLESAALEAIPKLEGAYALAVISANEPDTILAARNGGPPLVIGYRKNDIVLASDFMAFANDIDAVQILGDGEIAVITRDQVKIIKFDGARVGKKKTGIWWEFEAADKAGYPHYMLKEIYEQPEAVKKTIHAQLVNYTSKLHFPHADITSRNYDFGAVERITITACGTSWHAALVGRQLIEFITRVPVDVEIASEYRYQPIVNNKQKTLVIGISQSGETADTLGALRKAKQRGNKILSICNVQGSTMSREADGAIYTYAGPEVGVASTKCFTCQLTVLYLLAVSLGIEKGTLSALNAEKMINELKSVPEHLGKILGKNGELEKIARYFYESNSAMFLGRGIFYPLAAEGALKLKEISYISAEGYPAGELKHGPIALVNKDMPVLVIAPLGRLYSKVVSAIEEMKAREGKVIALASEDDDDIASRVDQVFTLPKCSELLMPILVAIPLQLIAYHTAAKLGCDVDKPRNLAKSVTVE